MKLSVVIPVRNGGDSLVRCLESVAASTRPPEEITVVDDCSTDGSADRARSFGARVIGLSSGPHGPALARNRGARESTGDILVFLDADVTVHPDTLERLESYLARHPEVAAIFGSYDDAPPNRGLVARYKNLLHHYVHQHGHRESFTFWSGCGAVRRETFAAVGGFDESRRRPHCEDIELGYRLRRGGHRVWLCGDLQVAHLKEWTLASLVRADILDRAVPWTRLILQDAELPGDLNLSTGSRLSAAAAWTAPAALALAPWSPWGPAVAILAIALLLALNADLYRFFLRRGGLRFALGAAGLHALYLLYSSATFVVIALPIILGKLREGNPTVLLSHAKHLPARQEETLRDTQGDIERALHRRVALYMARHALALLLLATLLKGLAWSVVVPPLHAHDEVVHFLYAQGVERSGSWQVRWGDQIPREMAVLRELAQLERTILPVRTLDLSDRAGIAELIALLDDPEVKRSQVPYAYSRESVFQSFTSYHPPLYYLLVGTVQSAMEHRSILVRLLASRWVSLLLALGTVLLAYKVGLELWPDRRDWPLLLATLVSFHPTFTFSGAVMGNQALEITLFSGFLLLSLRAVRCGLTVPRAAALGGIVALGLLTKISFLSVLPLLGLLFAWTLLRVERERREARALWPWIIVVAMPLLLSGWWYRDPVLSGGDTLVASYGTIAERDGLEMLPAALAVQLRNLPQYLSMYWGHFGWNETTMPRLLLGALILVTGISYWETGWMLVRRLSTRLRKADPAGLFALLFLGCAPLTYFAFYSYVEYRVLRDLGSSFIVQGRYFLPASIAQMAWLAVGLIQPVPRRFRRLGMGLMGAAMVAMNLYALFGVIVPRYYGPGSLPLQLERAAVLQPVDAATVLALCVGYAALALLVLALLWRQPATARPPCKRPATLL